MITLTLLITLFFHGLSAVLVLGTAFFVLFQNKKDILNQALFANFLVVGLYEVFFVTASLMTVYEFAYVFWFFNIIDVFIPVTTTLFIFAAINQVRKYRWYILGTLGVAFALFFSALAFPHLFLPQVLPKLYFPWYLDAGPLYVAMFSFFLLGIIFPVIKMVQAYTTGYERQRVEYFLFMYAAGYAIGSINFLLVFDIPADPLYGSFIFLSLIPLAYGVVTKKLFNIRTALATAIIYSGSIAILAALLTILISLNDLLVQSVPWVRFWTVPIFTATVAFIVGRLFWFKLIENDQVKYEFITVATHKLRTPLTQISWGVRTLMDSTLTPEQKTIIEHIQRSNARLIELTNLLFETTEEKSQSQAYQKEPVPLIATTKEVLARLDPFINNKQLRINIHSDTEVMALGDPRRIASVIEVLLENAINYSPQGELIQIITYTKRGTAYYSVRDHGIGVSSAEQQRIFSRFYRTDAAKRADTEGVGLGLAMARSIIKKHNGSMGVTSEGEGMGSVFWFKVRGVS